MALSALIAATREVDGAGAALVATLPLAGRTVIEHQARLAAHAGAERILILVERVPPALIAAIDRLRAGGITVDIARSVPDAADHIHPDETVLLFADGAIADPAAVAILATARPPALLTLADAPEAQAFERIDGAARWGGIALLDGLRLRRTAAMLGGWDLHSTLLRRAVQEGAERIVAAALPRGDGNTPLLLLVRDGADAERATAALLRGVPGGPRDWPGRLLYPLVERLVLRAVLPAPLDGAAIRLVAALFGVLAVLAFTTGWLWTGLALMLLTGPIAGVATRIEALRLGSAQRRVQQLLALVDHAAVLALAARLAAMGEGWGCWVLALGLIGATIAGEVEARLFAGLAPAIAALPGTADRLLALFAARRDGLWLSLLPFALFGRWTLGLTAMAAYAALSFAARQARLGARLAGLGGP